jgi:hypothetical protein
MRDMPKGPVLHGHPMSWIVKSNFAAGESLLALAFCSYLTFLGARLVRILPDFAGFCRGRRWIFFVFTVCEITLDQHVGVLIPGGQPKQNKRFTSYCHSPQKSSL